MPTIYSRLLLPVVLALAVLLPARAAAAPRNVVLFVTDDQGPDAGCYGNPVLKTPHLDRLAAEGTRFTHAFCTTASCSASRSVILTGLFNHANGQYGHEHSYHHFRTFDRVRSLPALLSRAGYRTARVGKFHVGPEEVYPFDVKLAGNPRNAVQMADRCKEFLTASSDKPFFLYFCTADPHRGGGTASELAQRPDRFGNRPGGQAYPGVREVRYDPKDVIVPPFLPDTPACRAELAQYYQAVSRIDQGLGRLIQVLQDAGKYDDTLIVYISDHGIAFPGAKTTTYEPGLRAPCVIRHPHASKRGVVSDTLISWVDLTPTLLDFAQARPARVNAFHGRSFLPMLQGKKVSGREEVFASHTFHEITMYYPGRVIRTKKYKLTLNLAHGLGFPFSSDLWASATWQDVRNRGLPTYGKRSVAAYLKRPQYELYDLEADPHEVKNLADDPGHVQVLVELKKRLKEWQIQTGDPWVVKYEHE